MLLVILEIKNETAFSQNRTTDLMIYKTILRKNLTIKHLKKNLKLSKIKKFDFQADTVLNKNSKRLKHLCL